MVRHDSAAARRETHAHAMDQARKLHRTRVSESATTLKQRARAARMAGLDAITVHLPVGDATLIANALTEWANRSARDEVRAAVAGRKDGAS